MPFPWSAPRSRFPLQIRWTEAFLKMWSSPGMLLLFTFLFFSLFLGIPTSAQGAASGSKCLAVTIDDLPCVGPRTRPARQNIERLVGHLSRFKVRATGFITGSNGNVKDIQPWINAGLPVGNHTFSHPFFSKITFDAFVADIEKNRRLVSQTLGVELQGGFFRYPYLDHGNSAEKIQAFEAYLQKTSSRLAHVSFDTIDYRFASEYKSQMNRELVGKMYVDHLIECSGHFASMSRLLYQREIPLIMLIHANELNADMLGEALDRLQQEGWRFVSLEEAVADPAYQPWLYRPPLLKCTGDRNFLNQVAVSRGLSVPDLSGDGHFKKYWLPRIRNGR